MSEERRLHEGKPLLSQSQPEFQAGKSQATTTPPRATRTGTMFLSLVFLMATGAVRGQELELLIKNGHVIDPRNGINEVADVGIRGGRIAEVGPEIAADKAERVVDAEGMYVMPGLIDIHVHAFHGTDAQAYLSNGPSALPPDGFTLRHGVTTAVDAGGAGWRSFDQFRQQVIQPAKVRLLAFLNIVGSGMKGGPTEQDHSDMDAAATAACVSGNRQHIVGIKVAHYLGSDWFPVDSAVEAGRRSGVPVMIDFGRHEPELSLDELLNRHLRPKDILTHTYASVTGRIPLVDSRGQVRDYAWAARRRGVLFDVGHGAGSFLFSQAVPAVRQGFLPDSISTDLHTGSMNGGMKDMLNVMSKFLNLGVSLSDVVLLSTWKPAQAIQRDDLGNLGVGAPADVTILSLRRGAFGFLDVADRRMNGDRRLECELTLRDGKVVWDLNGISKDNWQEH